MKRIFPVAATGNECPRKERPRRGKYLAMVTQLGDENVLPQNVPC